jgi:uncharacterized membrane protein
MWLGNFDFMIVVETFNRRLKQMITINLDQESTPIKKDREGKISYTGLGVTFGAGLGVLFSQLFFENDFAVGVGIGAAIGLILGSSLDVHTDDDKPGSEFDHVEWR